MDPQQMAQFVGSIPPVGGQPQQPVMPMAPLTPEAPVFQPGANPMFPATPVMPAAPLMGPAPAPGAPFTPPAPTWPQMPQYQQPGQPPAPMVPGGTIFQQPGQQPQQPQLRPGEIPLTVPQLQLPGQQADQVPAWAQGLIQQVAEMQNKGPQDGQQWDENNRPRTWQEMQQSMEKMAETKAQALIQGMADQQQQQAQQQAQLQAQANQNLDMVESQLTQMGMLPAVANPADPNDPGKLARQELYAYAMAMGATEPQHMAPAAMTLYTLHQNGQYFDRTKNSIVTRNSAAPGAFAPIAGAGPSMAGGAPGNGQQTGPTVAQLATLPLSGIAQMGARALGLGQ
jgi:hypothetical protein